MTRLLKNASEDAASADRRVHGIHPSRNTVLLRAMFRKESTVEAFLTRSFLFERARGQMQPMRIVDDGRDKARHQQSAKLHCLYGEPILNIGRTRSSRMYPFACSKVYDLRQYTDRTMWGPFMDDGSGNVDWERMEAILIVLGSNIKHKHLLASRNFRNIWATPFEGSWPGSYLGVPRIKAAPLDLEDPYNVAGTWLRVGVSWPFAL